MVEDVCPSDPRKKHEYIQLIRLKKGLAINTAMLIYKHGNSVENTNFVCKVSKPSTDFVKLKKQLKKLSKILLHFTQRQ